MRTLLLPIAAAALTAAPVLAQRTLSTGEPAHGTLSASDPQLSDRTYFDEYVFDARRGETVTLDLESDEFDAYLYLGRETRGGYRELARDDDGGSGTDSRLRYTIPEDGRYLVRASSLRRDTGPYRLSLHRAGGRYGDDDYGRGGDDYGRGGWDDDGHRRHGVESRIQANRPVRDYLSRSDARLDNDAPFHLYRYSGRRGEHLTITLRSDDFDSYLVIGTPGGRHGIARALARNDDGGQGYDSRIEYTLPYDGDFVIRVNPMSTDFGRYVLEVESYRRGGDWDDGRDYPRDGNLDRAMIGLWGLTSADRNGRDWGVLSLRANGDFSWRRDGQVVRGRLESTRDRGDYRRQTFRMVSRGEEFELSYTPSREGRLELMRRGRVVAFGSRYERRRDSQIPLDDPELRIEPEDTLNIQR